MEWNIEKKKKKQTPVIKCKLNKAIEEKKNECGCCIYSPLCNKIRTN